MPSASVNLSPLAQYCSRAPLLHDRVYNLPCGRWALSVVFNPSQFPLCWGGYQNLFVIKFSFDRTRYVIYLMAIWCIGFIYFISFMRGKVSSRLTLLVWMAPLTPLRMIIKGLTFQPWAHEASNKGSYYHVVFWWFGVFIMCESEFDYLNGEVRCGYQWCSFLECNSFDVYYV
jgi:hypothetical protein